MIAVVVANSAPRALQSVIEHGAFDVVRRAGKRYALFNVPDGGGDTRFVDPTDGALLISLHYFPSEADARRWVEADATLGAQPKGVH